MPTISPSANEALELLGTRVAEARRARRWTARELAERLGVTEVTLRKVERGDPTVRAGTMFEAAAICGVVLFDADPQRRALEHEQAKLRLALLPASVRPARDVDDDF